MPQKTPTAKKGSYARQKKVSLSPKSGNVKSSPAHGKQYQSSKGVSPVGSKVGFGAQSATHSGTKAVRAFQFAKSDTGASLASLHMKGKKGKSAKFQGYRK